MSLRSITCTSSLRWCSTTVQPHNTLTIRRSDYSFTVAWTLLFHLNDRFQMFFFPSYYNPPSNYKPTKKTVTKLYKPRACNPDSTVITQNLNLALIFSVIFITLVGLGGPRLCFTADLDLCPELILTVYNYSNKSEVPCKRKIQFLRWNCIGALL